MPMQHKTTQTAEKPRCSSTSSRELAACFASLKAGTSSIKAELNSLKTEAKLTQCVYLMGLACLVYINVRLYLG